MATNHSTETIAKLLKANHPETYTLWASCVWCVIGKERCFQIPTEAAAFTCLNWPPLWVTITGGYSCIHA